MVKFLSSISSQQQQFFFFGLGAQARYLCRQHIHRVGLLWQVSWADRDDRTAWIPQSLIMLIFPSQSPTKFLFSDCTEKSNDPHTIIQLHLPGGPVQ